MSKKKSLKTEIVLDYMKRFPKTPKKSLAIKIYNENPEVFKDAEGIRAIIRYHAGAKGDISRKQVPKEQHMLGKPHPTNPYGFPEPIEETFEPYVIPVNIKSTLLLSDIHIPYHDMESLNIAIKYGIDQGVDSIILNGDVLDFYGVSRWEKDPRKRRFADEIDDGKHFFKKLREIFPDVHIYFKLGNHEERYESYLRTKAPELLDIQNFELEDVLDLRSQNIHIIKSKRIIKYGKLNVMHGHEFGRSVFSPVNPARGYYMRAKENMIAGHNHQTSEHSEKSLNDDVITTWSTGCLCHMKPDYMPFNKWNLGFAHIKKDKDGSFEVDNLRIIDGKIR